MNYSYSNIKRSIKELLRQYSISPNEEMGQYFICDYHLLRQEIKYANVGKNDVILEIGPGIGNLTELLAQRARKVVAIEKDPQFKDVLSELQRKYDNIDIIYADALDIDFPRFNKVVSNLPFKIALPLIFKILEYEFDIGILICQERLAHRICAKPGQKRYSRLSVQISRISDVKLLKIIPPMVFYPSPDVTSAIIRVKKTKPKFAIPSDDFFKEVLKFLFSLREKTLQDALSNLVEVGISRSKLRKIESSINKKILRKPIYMISPKEFGKVTWILWEKLDNDIVKHFYSFYKLRNLYTSASNT
jgi:16S rRNA (adenine1518-N6/adenine1519-N6)-dimethyltransferase